MRNDYQLLEDELLGRRFSHLNAKNVSMDRKVKETGCKSCGYRSGLSDCSENDEEIARQLQLDLEADSGSSLGLAWTFEGKDRTIYPPQSDELLTSGASGEEGFEILEVDSGFKMVEQHDCTVEKDALIARQYSRLMQQEHMKSRRYIAKTDDCTVEKDAMIARLMQEQEHLKSRSYIAKTPLRRRTRQFSKQTNSWEATGVTTSSDDGVSIETDEAIARALYTEQKNETPNAMGTLMSRGRFGVHMLTQQLPHLLDRIADIGQKGMTTKQIEKLPVQHYDKRSLKRIDTSDDFQKCSICLEDFNTGDRLRTLLCIHKFHVTCIDEWLKRYKGCCPICKEPTN